MIIKEIWKEKQIRQDQVHHMTIETYLRMIKVDVSKFVSKRENVEAENCRHNPFAYRGRDVPPKSSIRRIPMPRVAAFKLNMRDDTTHSHNHEEYRAEARHYRPIISSLYGDERLEMHRYRCLIPKVHRSHPKSCESAYIVHRAHIRLLEVSNDRYSVS